MKTKTIELLTEALENEKDALYQLYDELPRALDKECEVDIQDDILEHEEKLTEIQECLNWLTKDFNPQQASPEEFIYALVSIIEEPELGSKEFNDIVIENAKNLIPIYLK